MVRGCEGATVRRWVRAALLLAALTVTGCASSGRAVPRPFPGAAVPPSVETPPGSARPAATIVLSTALSLRGTPYRNGGSDPSGFDCSGFVQWVFAQHGTKLPREVRDQVRAGEDVDRDELRPGDLVFFETVTRGASHVGIALGGDEFVHAPSSRGVVRIERLSASYWSQRWVGARRVL